MRKWISQIMIGSLIATQQGVAQGIYIVKEGDVLSRVLQDKFPNDRLYGPKGKIAKVLALNSHISDSNKIFPNQRILFPESDEIAQQTLSESPEAASEENSKEPEPKIKEFSRENRKISEVQGLEGWEISALYGAKYLSIDQSGALGKASLGVLFLNNLKLNSEFHFDPWSFGFQMDSYQFKYETRTSGDSKQMYGLNFFGSYKWFLASLGIEQNPLFRNNNGTIEMTKMSLMFLSIGIKKDFDLELRKPTLLKLRGLVKYPFKSSTDNVDVENSSVKGFGLMGQLELNRQIFARDEYSFHASWMTQLGFQSLSQNVNWDTSSGQAKSTIMDASTAIGLMLDF